MPNRYLREGIIESEAVNSLSWLGEIFYRRLISRVDDFGLFYAHPALVRSSIFPLQLEKVSEAEIDPLLAECERAELLFRYECDGKKYLAMNKWEIGRAKKSRYPAPPESIQKKLSSKGSLIYGGQFSGSVGGMGDLSQIPSQEPEPATDRRRRRPNYPATEQEARDQASMIGVPPDYAATVWHEIEGRGGTDSNGNEVRNFASHVKSRWEHRRRKAGEQRPPKYGETREDDHERGF